MIRGNFAEIEGCKLQECDAAGQAFARLLEEFDRSRPEKQKMPGRISHANALEVEITRLAVTRGSFLGGQGEPRSDLAMLGQARAFARAHDHLERFVEVTQ